MLVCSSELNRGKGRKHTHLWKQHEIGVQFATTYIFHQRSLWARTRTIGRVLFELGIPLLLADLLGEKVLTIKQLQDAAAVFQRQHCEYITGETSKAVVRTQIRGRARIECWLAICQDGYPLDLFRIRGAKRQVKCKPTIPTGSRTLMIHFVSGRGRTPTIV